MRRLLIRPGAIGDLIVSLPALESLATDDTEVWVASQNVPLVRFAQRVRSIAGTGLDLLGLPDVDPPAPLLATLRGFDSVVSWYGARRPEFQDAVREFGLPFDFLPALPAGGARLHAADFYLAQAKALGGRRSDGALPRIDCPRNGTGPAVIHPFSGSAAKCWPIERYARLRDVLRARWCAGPEDELPDAARFGDLYELACWLAGARVYIGNDSGITHLAAAAGTPVVALFGPTDPAVWAPRGPRVRVVAAGRPGEPIESIPFEAVLEAVGSVW